MATNESWIDSWLWEDRSQVRYPPFKSLTVPQACLYILYKLRDYPGDQIHVQCRVDFLGLFLL